jgi:hypothetical protein
MPGCLFTHPLGGARLTHNRVMATIVRCTRGGLFETVWIPLFSLKAIRLGSKRLQRCPVHGRWELVQRVDPSTLSAVSLPKQPDIGPEAFRESCRVTRLRWC